MENFGLTSTTKTSSPLLTPTLASLKSERNLRKTYRSRMIDLTGLREMAVEQAEKDGINMQNDYVLNGIAYNPDTKV
jgi:hypothetical protein